MDTMSTQERIALATSMATMATEITNMKNVMTVVSGKVDTGNMQSSAQNGEILSRIAVLDSKHEGYTDYQDKCDTERKSMQEDITAMKTKCALIAVGFSWIVPAILEAALHITK